MSVSAVVHSFRLQKRHHVSIAAFDSSKQRPFAALIPTLVARGHLAAPYSRIGQSMAALRKTPDLYRA
jgi:hypothetical protein